MARRTTKINVRDKFYIITNGKESEKNYFELIKCKKSLFDVQVFFVNADPCELVKFAVDYLDDANQVWCVFDVDNFLQEGKLIAALNLAEKRGVKIAYSNIAFEVWLISHFEKCKASYKLADYEKVINKYLKENGSKATYQKSDKNLLEKIFLPNYKQAITNAKVVHQKYIKEHIQQFGEDSKHKIWEWMSCTTVYKLIEELRLQCD